MRTLVLLAALAAAPVLAHHGWSEYDSTRPLKLTGKIVGYGYEHPHGHVRLETPGRIWVGVLAPPSRMERRGLAREMLRPGATATLEGFPNRDKLEEMRAERITVGGKTIELR